MALTLDIKNNPFLRDVFEEGRQEGHQEGHLEGERGLLRRQLTRRFGPLPAWAEQQLDTADAATLEQWGLRLLEATSMEDMFRPS